MIIKNNPIGSTIPPKPFQKNTVAESPGFVTIDTLTSTDKKLIEAVTGSLQTVSNSGVQEVNLLATRIALDRFSGKLSGEVNKSYINNLIREQKDIPLSDSEKYSLIPFSTLEKALTFLDTKYKNVGANINTRA
jgi:hypothetical protein